MKQDFFTTLPSEITVDILSRLPAKCTMRCKCVCKPWLGLLTTPEFVKSHLSKSAPGLAVFKNGTESDEFKIIDYVALDEHPWEVAFNFNLPFHEPLHSSADGLLLLCTQWDTTDTDRCADILLCNPITREYIKLPSPRKTSSEPTFQMESYGFGVSKTSGQYKVVRIFVDDKPQVTPGFIVGNFEYQVYTVGTGSWRNIACNEKLTYVNMKGAFLNGNLHFLGLKPRCYMISCLDLETETFSYFSPPPISDSRKYRRLSVLRDCLCVCDNAGYRMASAYEIDIWLMKDYSDVKSWTKEFVIRKVYTDVCRGFLCPVKVFKNGDILMVEKNKLIYYSRKNETIREVDLCGLGSSTRRSATIYAPSFLPLKSFATENVSLF